MCCVGSWRAKARYSHWSQMFVISRHERHCFIRSYGELVGASASNRDVRLRPALRQLLPGHNLIGVSRSTTVNNDN